MNADTPYTIVDATGRPVPPHRIRHALRQRRTDSPDVYRDVFGTDSTDPAEVLVSEHNAGNVAVLVGGEHLCAC